MQPVVSGPDTTTSFPSTSSAWIEDAPHEQGSSLRAFGEAAEALNGEHQYDRDQRRDQDARPPAHKG